MNVRKLVLPVAGLGKRLRPLTLKTPKNLIPVGGKPILEYALEGARESGITDVVLVISPQHQSHFNAYVRAAKKRFPFSFHLRVQKKPFGNGRAVLAAADVIGKDPFVVQFCDDVFVYQKNVLGELLRVSKKYNAPTILLEKVPRKEMSRYGVVGIRKTSEAGIYRVLRFVEKPGKEDFANGLRLTNFIVPSPYVVPGRFMGHLKGVAPHAPFLPDALPWVFSIQEEIRRGGKVYGVELHGKRLDCGTLEGLKKSEEFLKKYNF